MINADSSILTRRSTLLGAVSTVLVFSVDSFASEWLQSDWSKSSHSEFRLIAGGSVSGKAGEHRAGIHMRMQAGFKTYWRHPGDSGVPPVFRFEGSQNLKSAVVQFPAPTRFADGAGGFSYGYHGPEVILPVRVTAVDSAKPVQLNIQMDYAVCEKLCVPASGQAMLVMKSTMPSGVNQALVAVEKRVPIALRQGEGDALKILALRQASEPEHFLVDVAMPSKITPDLFIEGESPWFLETKAFTANSDEKGTFLVAVIERSKAVDCTGADLILTLVSEKNAIEVRSRLDVALI